MEQRLLYNGKAMDKVISMKWKAVSHSAEMEQRSLCSGEVSDPNPNPNPNPRRDNCDGKK
jgi:hypothetical protein